MTILLSAVGAGVLIVAVAMILPCKACRKRRERFRAAHAAWKARQKTN